MCESSGSEDEGEGACDSEGDEFAAAAATEPDGETGGPWDSWLDYADALVPDEDVVAAATSEAVNWDFSADGDYIPAMPCVPSTDAHRVKNSESGRRLLFNAVVERPVGRKEIGEQPKAQEAMRKEWDRLRAKKVWDESWIREWNDVAREASQKGKEVNLAYLFGICVEKGSELDKSNPGRKYKCRVVFQGNRVSDQDWEAATF